MLCRNLKKEIFDQPSVQNRIESGPIKILGKRHHNEMQEDSCFTSTSRVNSECLTARS